MRLSISIAIITAALLLVASDSRAGLNFQHDRTFTVPGLSGFVRQMKFRDINGDGTPEVLACDTGKVVLYSISGDSIIFSAVPDSGYEISAIELADVNRDSVADVVVAYKMPIDIIPSPTYPIPRPMKWQITCYTGSSEFGDAVTDSLRCDIYDFESCLLRAVDMDNDGYSELLVSVDAAGSYMLGYDLIMVWTEGLSRLYRSFPDSITWLGNELITRVDCIPSDAGSVDYLANRDYYSANYIPASPDHVEFNNTLCFLLDSGGLKQIALPPFSTSFSCSYDKISHFSTSLCAVGDFDFDNSTTELLATHYFDFQCYPEMLDSSRSDMSMYRLTESQGTELIWSIEIKGMNYGRFIYHPDLPGYFFAFSADTLVLFRGVDGSIHSRLTDVPAGFRYWDYPYPDGIPRLIVTNGTQVSFYNLDVTTGIDDESSHSLPNSFAIGQPYPNPFNADLTIPVTLSKAQDVTVDVFNIVGERVGRLHQGKGKVGTNVVRWNASGLASGIYLIRAQSQGETRTVKAVLLK